MSGIAYYASQIVPMSESFVFGGSGDPLAPLDVASPDASPDGAAGRGDILLTSPDDVISSIALGAIL